MTRPGLAAVAAAVIVLTSWPIAAEALEPGAPPETRSGAAAAVPSAEASPTAEPGKSASPSAEAGSVSGLAQVTVPAAGTHRIRVAIAADPEQREALARVLLELMQRLSVEVEVEPIERVELREVLAPVPAGAPYLARCFVELRAQGEALLYVHDPVRDRVLERRIERTPGDDELAREELGHMLLASIEALLSGATVGAPRAELASAVATESKPAPEEAAPAVEAPVRSEPPAAEPSRASWGLRGALLYELAALGHGPGFTHGPVLAAMLRAPLQSAQLGLLLSAQYRFPFDVEADPVGMHLHAFALRALCTFESPLSARVALRVGLGAGADVTRIAPQSAASADVALSDARTLTLGVTRGLFGIDVRLSRLLALWAALAADVDLDRTQYVLVQRGGGDSRLITPWRVRPALSLGVVLP